MQVRLTLWVFVAALAAVVALGCGSDSSSDGGATSDTSTGSDAAGGGGDSGTAGDVSGGGGGAGPSDDDAAGPADDASGPTSDDTAMPAGDDDAGAEDAGPTGSDANAADDDSAAPVEDAGGAGSDDDAAEPADDATAEPDTAEPDTAQPGMPESTALALTTSDGKSLAATEHRLSTTADGAPGVLLIHQFNQSQAQWDPYLPALLERGLIVLTIDLRGHGASDAANGDLPVILNDPGQAPLDVQAGLAQLTGDSGADPDRIAIIGTSIGANLACVAGANGYGVKLPIAVSARDTAVANLAGKTVEELTFTGLFILATEDDSAGVQAATAQAFHAASASPSDVLILEGGDHGKDILANHPVAVDAVYDWLDTYL